MGKKEIRTKFRGAVFSRDKNTCRLCGRTDGRIDAHHITNRNDMPNGGYVASNGITLCDNGEEGCHFKVEEFYFSKEFTNGHENPFHPTQLYKLIGSNLTLAIKDSQRLKKE